MIRGKLLESQSAATVSTVTIQLGQDTTSQMDLNKFVRLIKIVETTLVENKKIRHQTAPITMGMPETRNKKWAQKKYM